MCNEENSTNQVFVARDYRGELLGAYANKEGARAHLEELATHFYGELKWYGDRHLHCGENADVWVGSIETLDILPRFIPPEQVSKAHGAPVMGIG